MVGDAAPLVRLHNAVAQDLTDKLGVGYWSKLRSVQRQRERILLSDGTIEGRTIYVLEEGDQLVATVVLSTKRAHFWRKSMWADPDSASLCVFDLAVPPARQGMGLGRRAMEFAEDLAQRYHLPYVRLDAFAQNPHSTAFYEHLGYDNRGTLVVNGVALVLYEKKIPPA